MRAAVLVLFFAPALVGHPGIHHDIERVSAAIEGAPKDVRLLVERGYYLRLDGKLEASLEDLNRAVRLDPSFRDAYAHRGMTYSAMGRSQEAEQDLSRFLSDGGRTAAVFAERAHIRARDGRIQDAIRDFDSALRLDVDVDLVMERGRLLESIDRTDEAAEGYRTALSQLGGAVVLRDALVELEIRRGRYDAAVDQINEQMKVTPVKTELLLRRAEILELAGRKAEAHRDRERALHEADRVLNRRASGLHLISRAKALAALGRIDEACTELRLAVAKAPRFKEGLELLTKLEGTKPHTVKSEGSGESFDVR